MQRIPAARRLDLSRWWSATCGRRAAASSSASIAAIAAHDYYRRAGTERDTVDRPVCRTDSGRTVYGGGGIYPGRRVSASARRADVGRADRRGRVALRWAGAHVSARRASTRASTHWPRAGALPAGALADFRKFAAAQGVTIPAATTRTASQPDPVPRIADAKSARRLRRGRCWIRRRKWRSTVCEGGVTGEVRRWSGQGCKR